MADHNGQPVPRSTMLAVIAACCLGPMLLLVLLTAVAGIAIGYAAAATLGATAASFCVVLMLAGHRRHRATQDGDGAQEKTTS